jgi:ribosomal protein S6--L-glutamate ligase
VASRPNKLLIISTSPGGRVARRIKDVAIQAGLQTAIYGIDEVSAITQRELEGAVILPRIAPEYNAQAIAVLAQLEAMGAHIVNSAESWVGSRDKWKSYLLFEAQNVPTPKSFLYPETTYDECVRALGGILLFKPIDGTHGEGIVIVSSEEELWGKTGIVQQYIQESAGVDMRVFVVGDKVVGAMRRVAAAGEFRANLHQGASATSVVIDPATSAIAVRAAKVLGLDIAGVDIVMSATGAMVLEANPSPGLGIEEYTGPIIVPEIIAFIKKIEI